MPHQPPDDKVGETKTPSRPQLDSTTRLLRQVRGGDDGARDRLVRRFLPILTNWARGRLPGAARDLAETDDLVQVTLLRALDKVDRFEYRREGAFLAYLRQILLNSIRYEIRRMGNRPAKETLDDRLDGTLEEEPPVLKDSGAGTVEAYESALQTLPEVQREAVILRVEFGYSYAQIAEAVESPSANAARMMVSRALVRLAEEMNARGS